MGKFIETTEGKTLKIIEKETRQIIKELTEEQKQIILELIKVGPLLTTNQTTLFINSKNYNNEKAKF